VLVKKSFYSMIRVPRDAMENLDLGVFYEYHT
jgi:hypothetical protein